MHLKTSSFVIMVLFSLQSSGSIQWPAGKYGIPKPIAGCPQADGFRWKTGWRLQDTNYYADHDKSNNSRSPQFHIDGSVTKITVNRSFCIKVDDDEKDRPEWPRGKYCIYKSNNNCAEGLTSGWVYWTDDKQYQLNQHDGYLPQGSYRTSTHIRFCCRTDGDKDEPILLPTQSPFFLLAYESAKCQMVKWAVASLEWIYYSTSDRNNNDNRNGSYPYNAAKKHPTIYYCYYQGCNKTFTAVNGTLKSPKYPKHYPNGQCCSWNIIVNTTQQIHLVFNSFSLQNESLTDELRVYDGENEKGVVLGVFYGGHPPPKEGIYSSSRRMFLIFKSDRNDSYTGFSASYFAVHRFTDSKKSTPVGLITSPHFLTSKTSIASGVTSSSTVTTPTTQTSKLTSSPAVFTTTVKTSNLTSSSSTQAWDMAPSSYVISMTLQTPEVTHPITHTIDTMIKTTPRGNPWTSTTKVSPKIGLIVAAVVVPVVSTILTALLVAGICYKRKRRKRVEGPEEEILLRKRRQTVEEPEEEISFRKRRKRVEGSDDEILLRLISEPAGPAEDTLFI